MTAPATASPAIMDDEEMMLLFKKFHIVTAGTRALEIIGDPAYDSYSFRDVLVEMLRAQEEGYIQRTSHKRLKAAGLKDPSATMQALLENPPEEITPQRLARLKDTEWIAGPSPLNLVVIGPTGSGKSFLIQALAHNACMQLLSVKYWRLAELATRLDEIRQDIAATNDLVKKISKYHLVIFDDFFTTEISTHATRVLFEIMEARTGQATAIVSQTGASDWGKFIPNQITAESLINRIMHPSMTIALKGEINLREKHQPREIL